MAIEISYDREVDAAYISLKKYSKDLVKDTISVDELDRGEINLDFDSNGKLCGIEILNASVILPAELLTK